MAEPEPSKKFTPRAEANREDLGEEGKSPYSSDELKTVRRKVKNSHKCKKLVSVSFR